MPNNNRYEISEALQMPLPLTKEEAMQETLTQEESAARRFPILPSNANVTVIPIIPGITLFGYIRFLNASPVETRVDIYANDLLLTRGKGRRSRQPDIAKTHDRDGSKTHSVTRLCLSACKIRPQACPSPYGLWARLIA